MGNRLIGVPENKTNKNKLIDEHHLDPEFLWHLPTGNIKKTSSGFNTKIQARDLFLSQIRFFSFFRVIDSSKRSFVNATIKIGLVKQTFSNLLILRKMIILKVNPR